MEKKSEIKVCVTGANGQLGKEFAAIQAFFPELTFEYTTREKLDVADKTAINSFFDNNDFSVIINCAGYTNVEKAESEPELANLINGEGVKNLALAAKKHEILLIHFSTDYVFDGGATKGYQENDIPNPINAYGKSKLLGEKYLQDIAPDYMIFRISWLYSSFGSNFVKTMLKLATTKLEVSVVSDQIGAPTYAKDLAFDVLSLLEKIYLENKSFDNGIYHYCNEGKVSWKDFAQEIFSIKKIECIVNPILTKDYPTKAKRPLWSVLNTHKINTQLEIYPSDWQEALKDCLDEIPITNE